MDYASKQVHMLRASRRPEFVIVNAWGREFRIVPTERQIRDVAARNRLADVTVEFVNVGFSLGMAPDIAQVCTVALPESIDSPSEGEGDAATVIELECESDDEMTLVVPEDDDITEVAPAPTIRARSLRRGA
jgi:hypothetical protein